MFVFDDLYFVDFVAVDLVRCWPWFVVMFVVLSPSFDFVFFVSTNLEIGWEEHPRNDLFVSSFKLNFNSINQSLITSSQSVITHKIDRC